MNHTFYLLFQPGYWNVQLDNTGGISSANDVWKSEQNVTICSANENSIFSFTLDSSGGAKIADKKSESLQKSPMVIRKHHLPLVCPSCRKTLSTLNLLLSHQVEMSHFVNLVCPVCSQESGTQRQYSSLPKLKRHVTSVNLLTETLKCNLCGQSYNRHDSWKRHLIHAHRCIRVGIARRYSAIQNLVKYTNLYIRNKFMHIQTSGEFMDCNLILIELYDKF